LSKFQIY